MLSTLHIENIAVIEQAEIAFDSGFNVLTGETGAGKSIVIDAISAILGERASREMIRTGEQKAFVSAIFSGVPELPWFAENQIPYEPELGISREIFADGENSCRVSGKPATVSTLRSSASSSSRSMARTIPSSCSMRRRISAISTCMPMTKRCWRITGRRTTRSASCSRRSAACPWTNRKSCVWSKR